MKMEQWASGLTERGAEIIRALDEDEKAGRLGRVSAETQVILDGMAPEMDALREEILRRGGK